MPLNQQQLNSATSHYLSEIQRYYQDEHSSEMSYRSPFQNWLECIFPKDEGYLVQHDQRAINGNKPDFIIIKNDVPLLYIEVKKVGENLNSVVSSGQASRYFGYANLIITDYLEFRLFRNGEKYEEPICLAISNKSTKEINVLTEQFERLARTVQDLVTSHKEPIKSGGHLAKIMGGRAQRIKDNLIDFLSKHTPENEGLFKIMEVIKENLLSDISIESFSDLYAQTLVYGLFAARYEDSTLEDFTRQEARDLIPSSNPFLQHFFDHIAGVDFPRRLDIIVSELCEVFCHADVKKLLSQYYTTSDKTIKDPIVHFYEDFLLEYDPAKKIEMGVFYTPLPVVNFIIKSVDLLLKRKLGISAGLADSQKITVQRDAFNNKGKLISQRVEYHKVQVLDFATGTGTFLHELVLYIHKTFSGQEGRWSAYVQSDLLPRLHGFELMVASYTIAHIKLALVLRATGIDKISRKINVYLTNSLDAPVNHVQQGTLFGLMESIAEENYSASRVKADYPIMVVVGNPPYSGLSQNRQFTDNSVYKVEPGGKLKLQERKNWLDDDYVKFIRLAESLVQKNKEGIIGLITAHGYIDNPTFRGMRWHLRETFDEIYVLDLHGNANKKESSPDGSKDENVFDIRTGVSIMIGIKLKRKTTHKTPASIFKIDLYGTRDSKFEYLNTHDIESAEWEQLSLDTESWKEAGNGSSEYEAGFSVDKLFPISSTGIITARDSVVIDKNKENLLKRMEKFSNPDFSDEDIRNWLFPGKKNGKYLAGESRGWKISDSRKALLGENHVENIQPIAYRPFDVRWIYYHPRMVDWGRQKVMANYLPGDNLGILTTKSIRDKDFAHVMVTNTMSEVIFLSGLTATNAVNFPLYVQNSLGDKTPNLNIEIVNSINSVAGITEPINILDYIYAYLSSPKYRGQFNELLKQNYPKVPYPSSKEIFWKLAELGASLRELQLITYANHEVLVTSYPVTGENEVKYVKYSDQKVYINESQYFGGISETDWNYYFGGYQPAQKWLKDRRGDRLSNLEIEHYQKIISAIRGTEEATRQIDHVLYDES